MSLSAHHPANRTRIMIKVIIKNYLQRKTGFMTYRVAVQVYEQEMWETLTHAAIFSDAARAEVFRAKVEKAVRTAQKPGCEFKDGKLFGLDLANWTWNPSVCCPFAALQKKPTAVPFAA